MLYEVITVKLLQQAMADTIGNTGFQSAGQAALDAVEEKHLGSGVGDRSALVVQQEARHFPPFSFAADA